MKTLLSALLLSSANLLAADEPWEIVRAASERISDQKIKISVTIRNLSKEDRIVPASPYDGQEGMAHPNSFLWPQRLALKDAISPLLSHYYAHNSRSCHPMGKLTVPPNGEVSFVMFDELATAGKRLLLVFGDSMTEPGVMVIGGLTVPQPMAAVPN